MIQKVSSSKCFSFRDISKKIPSLNIRNAKNCQSKYLTNERKSNLNRPSLNLIKIEDQRDCENEINANFQFKKKNNQSNTKLVTNNKQGYEQTSNIKSNSRFGNLYLPTAQIYFSTLSDIKDLTKVQSERSILANECLKFHNKARDISRYFFNWNTTPYKTNKFLYRKISPEKQEKSERKFAFFKNRNNLGLKLFRKKV